VTYVQTVSELLIAKLFSMMKQYDHISTVAINELRNSILSYLYDIVYNKIVILYGQAAGSELTRRYLIEAGASSVIDLYVNKKNGSSLTDLFHMQNNGLVNPSKKVCRYLNSIDPLKEAKVFAGSAVSAITMDNRKVIGRRQIIWREYEKKKYQTELTKGQIGYNPTYMDFMNGSQLNEIIEYCVKNRPTVVSGDAKGCVSMASDYVYFIGRDTSIKIIKEICNILYNKCEGVRIADYDEGTPATYYGFVFCDHIILYGPVEAIVGFRNKDHKIVAKGILTPLTLSGEQRIKSRKDVMTVVRKLVDRTGYKGAFCVDGSIKQNCFTVHEINTRICAGFALISKFYNNIVPFGIIDLIIRDGKSKNTKTLLNILDSYANKVCLSIDIKLWKNKKLENSLRKKIPLNGDLTNLENWKKLVRHQTMSHITPFSFS